ncbi:MAG: hypothetical protein L0H51_05045, partial [Psychrobacter sp.]|nr:hypothetical protein [Psychrobacter sp.]
LYLVAPDLNSIHTLLITLAYYEFGLRSRTVSIYGLQPLLRNINTLPVINTSVFIDCRIVR